MPKAPITNIIFGTMTLGYRGYGARVHDAATADAMLGTVSEFGHDQIDTCSDYGDGSCEQMLGDLRTAERFGIATRIHPGNFHGHEPENLKRVFKESLARLKTGKVKILYLVTRDSATPIASTLSAVQELHDEGLFEEFGVSNFQRMAGGGGIGNGRAQSLKPISPKRPSRAGGSPRWRRRPEAPKNEPGARVPRNLVANSPTALAHSPSIFDLLSGRAACQQRRKQ
jgi:hypothetical protein